MLQMVSHDRDPLRIITSTVPPHNFRASDHTNDGKKHLLLCASSSVATIKIPQILTALSNHPQLSIRLILTPFASTFLAGQSAEQPTLESLSFIPNVSAIYVDESEWAKPWERNDPILHIELRRWSDLMVIAPLSANMLAKIVGGMADGLLASVVRAWDTTGLIDGPGAETGVPVRKRIVVAPAMNTAMWRQPITARQIRILEEEWGVSDEAGKGSPEGWFEVMRPQEVGDGAMKDWREIVKVIEERLGLGSGE